MTPFLYYYKQNGSQPSGGGLNREISKKLNCIHRTAQRQMLFLALVFQPPVATECHCGSKEIQ